VTTLPNDAAAALPEVTCSVRPTGRSSGRPSCLTSWMASDCLYSASMRTAPNAFARPSRHSCRAALAPPRSAGPGSRRCLRTVHT